MTNCLRFLLLTTLSLLMLVPAAAQRTAAYGDWQLHLPTNRVRVMADAGPRIYVAAEDAFYAFDKETSTISLLSRRDGLTDVNVRTLAYDSLTQQVVVVYASGTIDLLQPSGRVVGSITDIRRRAITGEKTVFSVSCARRIAYLSTSFGIVAVDLQRREIRDTYANIGPGGVIPRVFATTVQGDSLYAATTEGLLRGRLGTNLLDFNNWRGTAGFGPGTGYRTLVTHQSKVYAGVDGINLFRAVGANWVSMNYGAVNFRALRSSAAGLLIAEPTRLTVLDARANRVRQRLQLPLFTSLTDVARASSGSLFVGDYSNGLIRVGLDGQNPERLVVNAPASGQPFSISTHAPSNTVDVFAGGYSDRFLQLDRPAAFFQFDADGRWQNITRETLPRAEFPDTLRDFSRGVRTSDGTLYIASYAHGLFEWKGPGDYRLYNTNNSPLRSALSSTQFPRSFRNYVRVTDVTTDKEGNVWLVNRHQQAQVSGVVKFTPSTGAFQPLPYFTGSENLDRIVLDDNNAVWATQARLAGSGLNAFDPATGNSRYFSLANGLPSNSLYDIVKDRRGDIWVATSAGAAVYNDPGLAFGPDAPGFRTPFVRRGSGTGFPLLYTEVVKAIAVDGGNRKWFGTDNGLWLFSEDGDEALQHFTTANSPLPSNKILDVAVHDRTGEVFVATEGGLVSYRGSATVTEGKPDCAKVYPNPVRSDYSGPVGISGLSNNAEVKITDVTGTLVYQTRATGGSVVWNLADYNGRRVQSGVYLVMTSDAQGQNGCIAKVAVLAR